MDKNINIAKEVDRNLVIGYSKPTELGHYSKAITTFEIAVLNFKGILSIQGSILKEPTEEDWFSIYSHEFGINLTYNYPTTDLYETRTLFVNYSGKLRNVRVKIDRSYIPNIYAFSLDDNKLMKYGQVDRVLMKY